MEPRVTSETTPGSERPRTSRAVHRVSELTTRPLMAVLVGCLVVAFWIAIVATGFDQDLQVAFASLCAGVTVTMVFVLQHTQRREQTTVQLKLNELVRALPRADDHLIGVEASSDGELVELEQSHLDHHAALRDDDTRSTGVEASSDGELVELEQSHLDHHAALRDDDPRPPGTR